jgi:hypothetical protein
LQYADLKDKFVVFKFQTAGVADHVWAILQKPGPEYKIYQSYNMGEKIIFYSIFFLGGGGGGKMPSFFSAHLRM